MIISVLANNVLINVEQFFVDRYIRWVVGYNLLLLQFCVGKNCVMTLGLLMKKMIQCQARNLAVDRSCVLFIR
ncbi:hypothetical protein A9K61_19090 [Stenotrophomonas maltophilia]|nr:hypothetical protein A9K61_19090 [Stenotrophomonas maltophilia]